MAKLSLKANPTFQAKVDIPVAGDKSVPVVMTFKHRTKSALADFVASRSDKTDEESFFDMVEAWDLAEPLNAENVGYLLENYIGAAVATYRTYIDELTKAKEKN